MSRASSKMEDMRSSVSGRQSVRSSVVVAHDGSMERYDPEAFREAALRSMDTRPAASFSPMQMREMSRQPEPPSMPGALALQDSGGPMDGMPTGYGYYQREL